MKVWEKGILGLVFLAIVCVVTWGITGLDEGHGQAINVQDQVLRANGWCKYTGYQTLTPNSTTASILTQTSMGVNTTIAWITVETAALRYKMNGGTPSTTDGHSLAAAGTLMLKGRHQINNFKVISVSTHGKLFISYGE